MIPCQSNCSIGWIRWQCPDLTGDNDSRPRFREANRLHGEAEFTEHRSADWICYVCFHEVDPFIGCYDWLDCSGFTIDPARLEAFLPPRLRGGSVGPCLPLPNSWMRNSKHWMPKPRPRSKNWCATPWNWWRPKTAPPGPS